jgi:hypothetical protein
MGGGGDPQEGWEITAFWLYYTDGRTSETSSLGLWIGDSESWRHVNVDNESEADFPETVPPSIESQFLDGGKVATLDWNEVHLCKPGISGRGLTVTWELDAPESGYDLGQPKTCFMGFGGVRKPGSGGRGWRQVMVGG